MADKIRVLLIDDDEEDYLQTMEVIEEIEGKQYEVTWVSDYERGKQETHNNEYDVCLVDYRLGPTIGLDLIRESVAGGYDIPMILLTGIRSEQVDAEAEEAGAADYLVKGAVTAEMLDRSIRYSMARAKSLRQIREMNTALEARVKERTLELENLNTNLRHSQLQLTNALATERELNELKSRFVTTASHEFRTPLATILSSASLIQRYTTEEDQPKREKHIYRIKTAVANLTSILNDFLSLARLEEGEVKPQPEWFDPADLLHEAIDELSAISKSGQEIRLDTADIPAQVFLDRQMVKNVVINLISNAIKYSAEDKVIAVTARNEKEFLRLEVKDQGIGIPESDQAHLFKRFFRAKNATNYQGTGLGLNITRKYVLLMNGDIRFTSSPQTGSVFTVVLPGIADLQEKENPDQSDSFNSTQTMQDSGNLKSTSKRADQDHAENAH